ncbi:NB-ARC domains-containing protein [Artemisia annua]|uniref:NB-ARC domains-containing protein n=1 Tax=Artemisia annua TaxID=35608 RepID=A0A2U1Q640_ARTAN|nr:NB-ARC domains-containing protein [Artemisia annua]
MAEAVAAGAGVAAALIQGKTALWDPLKRTIASSNDMDEIYGALDEAMNTLVAKKDDHDNMVQRRRTTMMPSNTYINWNYRVNVVAKEVEKLKVMYLKERKRSSWFSFNTRSNFTKKMKKTATRVFALMEEDTQLVDVLVDKEPARVVEMITPTITNIPTLQKPLEQTLGWLCDEKVRGIRIHGLVGSGKTTIMQNLNNHVKVAEMFDIVIWVTVSREGSMENRAIDQIQQIIAQRLKLDIDVTTHHDLVASRIREELKSIKYVLLLDDVKEDLNLDKIGVPMSDNGSKIVFTTRLQHVCSSIATRQTNVAPLNRKEALIMFKSVLDRPHLEENSSIKRLMPQIINWCGYHPLMIKVAAGVFRVKDTEESWHDGLMNLRKWPEKGDDTMQEIYRLLNSCFDCLKVTQKKCFFYSALYPEDSDIQKDCLLDNWAAEELLDAGDGVEVMRANGREVLDYLKMVSLLEENTVQQCIRMHKLIRLAALYNLSTNADQGILVKSGEALHKPVDVEFWKEKKWISLVDSKMNALPDQPDCSILSTLILQKNKNLEVIPRAFFKHMQSLRVLDLYDTRITSLPNSLLKLATLKVLYLQKCVALVELHREIGNLQKLEVLDIRGSGLENIPPQVESLISLRRLLVSFTSSMSINPTQKAANEVEVISKIPMLKELVVDVEDGLERILYGAIVNVVRLTRLSLLQFCFSDKVVDHIKAIGGSWKIYFPNERLLQSYIDRPDSVEFDKCQIFTGCDFSSHPHIMKFMPYFKFDGEVSDDTISQVLCNDVAIELVNHNGLEHLSSFTTENMNRIRSCVIKDCKKMRTIVDDNTGGGSILDNMEQLHMINLPVLKNICEGPMQGLKSLKTLILCNCPMLTWVCTYGVILQLPEIRHLEVERCPEIKEIFNGSTNIVSPILPNLKKLILVDMPQLRSILVSNSFEWPSLERLKILGCPKLKRLPFQKDGAVKLTSIEAEKSWWEALENDQEVTDQFRRYCTLK